MSWLRCPECLSQICDANFSVAVPCGHCYHTHCAEHVWHLHRSTVLCSGCRNDIGKMIPTFLPMSNCQHIPAEFQNEESMRLQREVRKLKATLDKLTEENTELLRTCATVHSRIQVMRLALREKAVASHIPEDKICSLTKYVDEVVNSLPISIQSFGNRELEEYVESTEGEERVAHAILSQHKLELVQKRNRILGLKRELKELCAAARYAPVDQPSEQSNCLSPARSSMSGAIHPYVTSSVAPCGELGNFAAHRDEAAEALGDVVTEHTEDLIPPGRTVIDVDACTVSSSGDSVAIVERPTVSASALPVVRRAAKRAHVAQFAPVGNTRRFFPEWNHRSGIQVDLPDLI